MQPHTPNTLIESFVHALSHITLLWCPRNGLLHSNFMGSTILIKPSIYTLPSIVWPQTFYFQICFCLNRDLPLLKSLKYIRFIFQKISPYFSTWVFNESDIIPWTSKGCNRRRPLQISVYQLQFSRLQCPASILRGSPFFAFLRCSFHTYQN